MTLPDPAYIVIIQHITTRAAALFQCFSRAEAEALLAAYEDHGWIGGVVSLRPSVAERASS